MLLSSVNAWLAGVPVSSHNRVSGRTSLLTDFQRRVATFFTALASSSTIRSNPPASSVSCTVWIPS